MTTPSTPTTPTTPGQIGPYRLAQVLIAGGDESVMFEATVVDAAGEAVAVVSNSGHGGCDTHRPGVRGYEGVREFLAYADVWGGEHGVTFEPADTLVSTLLEQWADGQETESIYG